MVIRKEEPQHQLIKTHFPFHRDKVNQKLEQAAVRVGNEDKTLAYPSTNLMYNSPHWSPSPRASLHTAGPKQLLLPSFSFHSEHAQLVFQCSLQLSLGPGKLCSQCLALLIETQHLVWTAFIRPQQRQDAGKLQKGGCRNKMERKAPLGQRLFSLSKLCNCDSPPPSGQLARCDILYF